MLNDIQKSKVQRFANDESLSCAVKEVIQKSFLKPKPNRDVYQLAGVTIAIGLLEEAWKEIDGYRENTDDEKSSSVQIGL